MTKFLSILLLNIPFLLTSPLFAGEEDKVQLGSNLLSKKLIVSSPSDIGKSKLSQSEELLLHSASLYGKSVLAIETRFSRLEKLPSPFEELILNAFKEGKIRLGRQNLSIQLIMDSLERQHEKLSLRTTIRSDEFENAEELDQKTSGLKAINKRITYSPKYPKDYEDFLYVMSFNVLSWHQNLILTHKNDKKILHYPLAINFTSSRWEGDLKKSQEVNYIEAEFYQKMDYSQNTPLYLCLVKKTGHSTTDIKIFLELLEKASINNVNATPSILIATDAVRPDYYELLEKLKFKKVSTVDNPTGYNLPKELKYLQRIHINISHIIGINTQHIPALKAITVTKEEG